MPTSHFFGKLKLSNTAESSCNLLIKKTTKQKNKNKNNKNKKRKIKTKNNYFTSCTQKAAIAIATNMEKHILQYRRWVV